MCDIFQLCFDFDDKFYFLKYQNNCYRDLKNERLMKVRNNKHELESPDETALGFVVRSIKNETEKV